MTFQENELLAVLSYVESLTLAEVSSLDLLREHAIKIQGWMAFSAGQMVIASEELHTRRKGAYLSVYGSLKATDKKIPQVSIIKDYINDVVGKEVANYLLAERVNRTCTHALTLSVTLISACKEEMRNLNYQT